jgi:hypothetical protein
MRADVICISLIASPLYEVILYIRYERPNIRSLNCKGVHLKFLNREPEYDQKLRTIVKQFFQKIYSLSLSIFTNFHNRSTLQECRALRIPFSLVISI